jgi:hypothetical protein
MGASSVRRWVKHFKDGNTDIADQPRCGRQRIPVTERNKQKVNVTDVICFWMHTFISF